MAETALALERPPVEYPESDGEPMAETDDYRDELAEIVFTLKRYFRDRDDVYVSGNLFVYYEEGNPGKRRAPDVFVVLGVPKKQRRTYRLWDEGEAPVMAIELTSKETKEQDRKLKPKIYARLGIQYLFLYDVLGEYLDPSLRRMRLGRDGLYRELVGSPGKPLPCPPLGLDLILDDAGRLQFVDRRTGELVIRMRPALDQAEAALRKEAAALREEAAARRKAEAALEQEAAARRKAEESAEQARRAAATEKQEMMAEIERLKALQSVRKRTPES